MKCAYYGLLALYYRIVWLPDTEIRVYRALSG